VHLIAVPLAVVVLVTVTVAVTVVAGLAVASTGCWPPPLPAVPMSMPATRRPVRYGRRVRVQELMGS